MARATGGGDVEDLTHAAQVAPSTRIASAPPGTPNAPDPAAPHPATSPTPSTRTSVCRMNAPGTSAAVGERRWSRGRGPLEVGGQVKGRAARPGLTPGAARSRSSAERPARSRNLRQPSRTSRNGLAGHRGSRGPSRPVRSGGGRLPAVPTGCPGFAPRDRTAEGAAGRSRFGARRFGSDAERSRPLPEGVSRGRRSGRHRPDAGARRSRPTPGTGRRPLFSHARRRERRTRRPRVGPADHPSGCFRRCASDGSTHETAGRWTPVPHRGGPRRPCRRRR
jgi:hypothetical protein